jgi:hypothetical protein
LIRVLRLVLAFGASLDVRLQVTSAGRVDWPAPVLVAAGSVAVAFSACRVGVPRRALGSAAVLGGVAVVLARGLTPLSADLNRPARTLVAALVIGVVGRLLAYRSRAPSALWMVPAILPLLPAPSTLLPHWPRPNPPARPCRAWRRRRRSLSAWASRPGPGSMAAPGGQATRSRPATRQIGPWRW